MNTVDIRPGVSIAYETVLRRAMDGAQTIVMVHGNAESSRAWTCWMPHLAGKYRVVRPDMPGFGASVHRLTIAGVLPRWRTISAVSSTHCTSRNVDRRQMWRFGHHAIRDRSFRPIAVTGPVRGPCAGRRCEAAAAATPTRSTRSAISPMGNRCCGPAYGSATSSAQVTWWTDELMGKTDPRAAFGISSARIDMELENNLSRIACPTLIVTTQESGLQSVAAVEAYARRIPDARVIVLPGQLSHRRRGTGPLCASSTEFLAANFWRDEVSAPRTRRDMVARMLGGVASAAWAPRLALAQWPSRPVRIICRFRRAATPS